MKKLYVGNLPYSTTEQELIEMFEAHGQVESAVIIMDRETGRSKGFGFIEMNEDSEADASMAALNGQKIGDRELRVNEARPRNDSRGGGGGGGGGRGGGGGGYGGGGGGGGSRW
jgi:cold-inducible RNA-binding protein